MKKSMLVMLGFVALVGSLFFSTETLAQTCNNRNNNTAYRYQQNYGYQNYGYQRNNSINYQQNSQVNRINKGLRTGQLTPQEAYRLRQQEALIRQQEQLAKRDGYVSYQERQRINRELNQVSRQIHQEKHDSETTCNTRNSRTYTTRNYNSRTYTTRNYWPR